MGHFTGSYTGTYRTGLTTTATAGTVDFSVDANGAVTGTWTGTSNKTSKADIVGTLDCATGDLMADIKNGSYSVNIGPVVTSYKYSGTFSGAFDTGNSSFTGVWAVQETGGGGSGSGTWTTQ